MSSSEINSFFSLSVNSQCRIKEKKKWKRKGGNDGKEYSIKKKKWGRNEEANHFEIIIIVIFTAGMENPWLLAYW